MSGYSLGFCWLDIVAAAVLLAVIILYVVRTKKLKSRAEELRELVGEAQGVADSVDYIVPLEEKNEQ